MGEHIEILNVPVLRKLFVFTPVPLVVHDCDAETLGNLASYFNALRKVSMR